MASLPQAASDGLETKPNCSVGVISGWLAAVPSPRWLNSDWLPLSIHHSASDRWTLRKIASREFYGHSGFGSPASRNSPRHSKNRACVVFRPGLNAECPVVRYEDGNTPRRILDADQPNLGPRFSSNSTVRRVEDSSPQKYVRRDCGWALFHRSGAREPRNSAGPARRSGEAAIFLFRRAAG